MIERTIITDDYKSLFSDDGTDVVFAGTNADNEIIIVSLIEEDDDAKVVKEFRSIADVDTLFEFMSGNLSYLQVLKRAKDVYMTEVSYSDYSTRKPSKAKKIELDSISKDILPLENSYIKFKKA